MAKLRKAKKYKSDYMSRQMDERLEQLEDSLTALYANASLETQADLYVFMKGHKKAYEAMTDKLNKGEITEAEYKRWCNNQILKTTKYKDTIDTITDTLVKTDVAAMAIVRGELPFVIAQSYNFAKSLGFAAADKAGLTKRDLGRDGRGYLLCQPQRPWSGGHHRHQERCAYGMQSFHVRRS